ncbi:MAG: hypothetical protein D6771_04520 [Zetaproteobacteria bacterium]|nr:MAG: hypothetical protein D6771_04520 [Zetaproteobacteria bacterium]
MVGIAPPAHAGKGVHFHFAAFFSTNGPGTVSYPDRVPGEDIEAALLKRGAEMLLFAHSVSVKDGDVITVANDTLRGGGSAFQDFGLDCNLAVKGGAELAIGGVCNVFVTDKKHKLVFKPVPVRERLVWIKIFEDKAQGVAGYVMAEEGADIARTR